MKAVEKRRYNIFTHTGKVISGVDKPINPRLIDIKDIAHGLSNLCRFSGQCNFYTVAAHSILVSLLIEKSGGTRQEQLWGLLHDASEAYITDLPLPVKIFCPDYYKIEMRFMEAVCKHFGLPIEMPEIVKYADKAILREEKKQIFRRKPKFPLIGKHPKKAFLRRFEELAQ